MFDLLIGFCIASAGLLGTVSIVGTAWSVFHGILRGKTDPECYRETCLLEGGFLLGVLFTFLNIFFVSTVIVLWGLL